MGSVYAIRHIVGVACGGADRRSAQPRALAVRGAPPRPAATSSFGSLEPIVLAGQIAQPARSRPSQMPLVPVDDALEQVELVLALADGVRLTRVGDELRLHAASLQTLVELVPLRDRHARVGLAVEDEGRGDRVLDVADRR